MGLGTLWDEAKSKYSDTLRYLVGGVIKQVIVQLISMANDHWHLGLTPEQILAVALACATVTVGQIAGQVMKPAPPPATPPA